ncbi:unnamed protein product [Pleuronectes platessa]|uniref:Uncharacterized protein n=1 Tax=Pleuronectes platessa TaxID=8262 RepID=A0A9N7YY66_PLEPL|nr:unnamed protein product [Pleuronectes platessa]
MELNGLDSFKNLSARCYKSEPNLKQSQLKFLHEGYGAATTLNYKVNRCVLLIGERRHRATRSHTGPPWSAVILSPPTHTASFAARREAARQLPEKTGATAASPGDTSGGIKCNGPGFQSTRLKIPCQATVKASQRYRCLFALDSVSSWDGAGDEGG